MNEWMNEQMNEWKNEEAAGVNDGGNEWIVQCLCKFGACLPAKKII